MDAEVLVCVPVPEEARVGLVGRALWGRQAWRRPVVFGALCATAMAPPRTASIDEKRVGGVPAGCQFGYAAVAYIVQAHLARSA